MTEEEFVKGLKNRDHKVFEIFVKTFQENVIRTCYGFVRDNEDARDLAQDVFMEIYQSIQKFKYNSKLSTWMYRIAANKSLNFIRSKKSKKNLVLALNPDLNQLNVETNNHQNNYDDKDEKNYKKKIIFQAMNGLPERQRTAFILNKYEDLSYKDIAEIMDTSLSSVESLIHRAKSFLQKELINFYKKNGI